MPKIAFIMLNISKIMQLLLYAEYWLIYAKYCKSISNIVQIMSNI
jgi:hypothetical protein